MAHTSNASSPLGEDRGESRTANVNRFVVAAAVSAAKERRLAQRLYNVSDLCNCDKHECVDRLATHGEDRQPV
jgi:hypothetical protein